MYPADVMARSGMGGLLKYNPLTYLLRIVRDPLIGGQVPSWRAYGIALASTLVAAAIAMLLLGRLQRKVVLYL
jgi:ABC-type polysaccharide/polyol phosphate export permease